VLHGIDHIVMLVSDLEAAIESYTTLGFTVVPGGKHPVGTHNALIGFEDGAYIELIAFWEDAPEHRWFPYLSKGGGLVDYCMRTDDLDGDVAVLRASGIAMSDRMPSSRARPDGYEVKWVLSLAVETQGVTPFMIEDITPRSERVPAQTHHANGVVGIDALTLVVQDLGLVERLAEVFKSKPERVDREDLVADGLRLQSGNHAFDYVEAGASGPLRDFIERRGAGTNSAILTRKGGLMTVRVPEL
jgi:Glyoxalase-like domain